MVLQRHGSSVFGFIFAVLILLIGVIGVCYANWNQELNITGSISTGELNVNLTILEVLCGDAVCEIEDKHNGSFYVSVENAAAGSEVALRLDIENIGTVPVTYQIYNVSDSPADELIVTLESSGDLLPGNSKQDTIKIHIPELNDGESAKEYTFKLELNFSQG